MRPGFMGSVCPEQPLPELINPADPDAVLASHIAQLNILKETCRVR